jgi:uncharacterized membrane protein YfcA
VFPALTGLAAGLVVGMVIGALGGGGGVLTIPVLVYLLGQTAHDATTSSVIIVGITAAVGAVTRMRAGLVRWRTGLAFAAVGVPAAFAGTLVNQRASEQVLLLTFAALTIVAAVALLVNTPAPEPADGARPTPRRRLTAVKVIGCGSAVGFLTGFLGVGGGFLVVPALVVVMGIPMRWAIGTSLLVIAVNAIAAMVARTGGPAPDWPLLAPFTAAAVAGTVLGKRISDRLTGVTLTRAFAVMLILVGGAVAVEVLVR